MSALLELKKHIYYEKEIDFESELAKDLSSRLLRYLTQIKKIGKTFNQDSFKITSLTEKPFYKFDITTQLLEREYIEEIRAYIKNEKIPNSVSVSKKTDIWSLKRRDNKFEDKTFIDEIIESKKKITCNICEGSGAATCDDCNGYGKLTCGDCSGDGRCTSCDGRGEKDCYKCGGNGKDNCNKCHGSGVCAVCNGRGKSVNCPDCRGIGGNLDVVFGSNFGDVTGFFSAGKCVKCKGKGQIVCKKCDGGGILSCSPCNASGKCSRCGGTGEVVCKKCNGSGKIPCVKCNKTGYLVSLLKLSEKFKINSENFEDGHEDYNQIYKLVHDNQYIQKYNFTGDLAGKLIQSDFLNNIPLISLQKFLISHQKSIDEIVSKKTQIDKQQFKVLKIEAFHIKYSVDNEEYECWYVFTKNDKKYSSGEYVLFDISSPLKVEAFEIAHNARKKIDEKKYSSAYNTLQELEKIDIPNFKLEELKEIVLSKLRKVFISGALVPILPIAGLFSILYGVIFKKIQFDLSFLIFIGLFSVFGVLSSFIFGTVFNKKWKSKKFKAGIITNSILLGLLTLNPFFPDNIYSPITNVYSGYLGVDNNKMTDNSYEKKEKDNKLQDSNINLKTYEGTLDAHGEAFGLTKNGKYIIGIDFDWSKTKQELRDKLDLYLFMNVKIKGIQTSSSKYPSIDANNKHFIIEKLQPLSLQKGDLVGNLFIKDTFNVCIRATVGDYYLKVDTNSKLKKYYKYLLNVFYTKHVENVKISKIELRVKGIIEKHKNGKQFIIFNSMTGNDFFEKFVKDNPYTGKSITYFKNGKKSSLVTRKEGKFHGKCIDWYENGQVSYEITYKNGKRTKFLSWHKNGKKYQDCSSYIDEKRNGKLITWYENGIKKEETNYLKGKVIGKILRWDKNGKEK